MSEKDFVKKVLSDMKSGVMRDKLGIAKETAKEAAKSFIEQGLDDEEVTALLMGAMAMVPNYNPAMDKFFELQIKRAIVEAHKAMKG